jgi:hypothetical protein
MKTTAALALVFLAFAGNVAAQTTTRCAKEGYNNEIVCRTESEHEYGRNPYHPYVPRGDYSGLGPTGYYIGRYLLGGEQRERKAREKQAEELGDLLGADCKSIGTTIYCRE